MDIVRIHTDDNQDVRWKQRLDNYGQALKTLSAAITLAASRPLSELETQGLIQGFEFTHELAWNLMKDYLEYQGIIGITGSRDAVRQAFNKRLILNADIWMEMLKSRNLSSHTYNIGIANDIADKILHTYNTEFTAFYQKMTSLA